ncbi:MAG: Hsp20/alpha crystallin family protein [Pseudolabrys sp.]
MTEGPAKISVSVDKQRHARKPAEGGPLDALRQQLDHLFDDFQRGYWHLPFRRGVLDVEPYWRGAVSLSAVPAVDIAETEGAYKVTAELPGVAQEDIGVKFSDGMLTITGEKHEEKEEKKADYFLSERRYGSFKRSFRVAEGIDADKIDAKFANGVLTVTLPKTAEARKKTKTVAIKKG